MKICVLCVLMMALVAGAESEPFNLSTFQPLDSSTELPLSIFTEQEQRRIAADFVLGAGGAGQVNLLRVPVDVKRAVEGAEKSMARSRKCAEKGLCSKEESANFLYQGTGGATLAVDPNSGHLHLQKYNWLDRLDVEKAVKGLTRFADTVNTWKELVTETMASASAASDVPSVPTQSEFMQVRPFAA